MNWTAVASLLAALAATAGVVFTGLSLQATRAQNAVIEQGRLTDRYGKAVDQLDRTGPEHLQSRLGAIYALERLSRDHPRDQSTIIEVLSAFIRTTTPQPVPASSTGTSPTTTTCPDQAVTPDVQAALTVLSRRNPTHDQITRIDLHNTCLANADLGNAHLHGANLGNAHLSRANLSGTNLGNANLGGANLGTANLLAADLRSAYLGGADLRSANLFGANLGNARLNGAQLHGADLSGVNLYGAIRDEQTVVTDVVTDTGTTGVWW